MSVEIRPETQKRTLSRARSYWVAAAVAAVALWTSAAPSLTYPLYEHEWALSPAVTTTIFAIYPIVLVAMLLVFGGISDFIGVRLTILIGLSASLAGVVLFAVAPDVWWVFAGRALMGVGVALSLSPATTAAIAFSPPGKSDLARATTTASTAVGYGLAVLVGGALVQFAPNPLHLNFWVLAVFIAVVICFAYFLPRNAGVVGPRRWRPTGITFPKGQRVFVAVGALTLAGSYMVAVIMISLGAQIASELIGSQNAAVNGGVIGLNALAVGVAAVAARRFPAKASVITGGLASVVGLGSIVASSTFQSLPLLLVSAVVLGVGYSLMFSGGLGVIGLSPLIAERAGMFSAGYLVAYLAQGSTALAIGALATAQGLGPALVEGSIGIGSVCVLAIAACLIWLPRAHSARMG